MDDWLNDIPLIWLGLIVPVLMVGAAAIGTALRARIDRGKDPGEGASSEEGYIVSAALGLLALLLAFTFSLAVDRFETRRTLVLEEANAIGTTYLRAQLLPEPHRERISGLLVDYTNNRITLAKAPRERVKALVAENDRLLVDLWAATAAAFVTVKDTDFSSAFLLSMNALIDMDTARKAARNTRVPTEVFIVLFIDLIVTAGILGYVLDANRSRFAALFLFGLLTATLLLILDIDRPTSGGIRESQMPMEWLKDTLQAQPPAAFDHYLKEDAGAAP